MRRIRAGRVVCAIEVDEMAAFLEWLDVEVTAKPHAAWTALEAVDAEPVLGRRDGEGRSGVSQIDIAAAADLEDLTDGHLVTRDRREERLWTGEPFAVAFAALLRFASVLVGRGHLVRAGSFAARASAWMVPSGPRPKSRVSGRSAPMGVLAAKR